MKYRRLISVILFLSAVVLHGAQPKYIFYFIGDGMGIGAVTVSNAYRQSVFEDKQPLLMMNFPVVSLVRTNSASSPVTDSAAAGTALATGHKTKNGMLGMGPDSSAVNSIANALFRNGYGVGLVTSVAPDDATPGAFYAHVPNRGMFYEIGKQMAESGYDFIAGAGLRGLRDSKGISTDLLSVFKNNGVAIIRGVEGLKHEKGKRVLLLDPDTLVTGRVGYIVDGLKGGLTLQQMTSACLSHLRKYRPDKFFMMVEGGAIDHAAHGNDGACVVGETLDFDKALTMAYDFYLKYPDETLIIVTADHETGGMAAGNTELYYNIRPDLFKYTKISGEQFSKYCKDVLKSGRKVEWKEMKDYLRCNFGLFDSIQVSQKDEDNLRKLFDDTFIKRTSADKKTLYNSFNFFAAEVFGLVNKFAGIGWTTNYHTGAMVPLFAIGNGSMKFSGPLDNTDIPRIIAEIAEVSL